ncbi:MAG: hypothetical protein KDJ66_08820, partial [Nitratireductor sp.]|nr:hypothetical protein [Nitratireductor sp.]
MKSGILSAVCAVFLTFGFIAMGGFARAQDDSADVKVKIRPDIAGVTVQTPDGPAEINRIQDEDNVITGDFARTSRACPPFCIQPMS